MTGAGRVGYVLECYPKLSETFVVNEILGLEKAGVDTGIFALGVASDPIFNPEVARVRGKVQYLAEMNSPRFVEIIAMVRDLEGSARDGFDRAVELTGLLPPSRRGLRLVQALHLAQLALEEGIRHLHAHFMSEAAAVACMAHLITGIPFSATAHAKEIYRRPVNVALIREIYRASTAFVTVCEANRRYLAEDVLHGHGSRVICVYNGLPLEDFTAAESSRRSEPLILGVGRLSDKKGWHVLLEACSHLRDRSVEFHCVICGAGKQRERLLQMRADLGLEACVDLPGPVRRSEVLDFMRKAAVLAAPCVVADDGNRDALPTVLLEALALGLPVVSTPVGGIPEIVEDGKEGLLVAENDAEALSCALEALLSDGRLRDRLSEAGRKKVAGKFDQRRTIPTLLRVFGAGAGVPDVTWSPSGVMAD